jgi:membrane protein YqaA with SNARE-associated domain
MPRFGLPSPNANATIPRFSLEWDMSDIEQKTEVQETAKKAGWMRRMYDWVLSWADSKYAEWYLFALAFAESSFFPIPPDVLLFALTLSKPHRAFRYAIVCTLGSVLGGAFGYAIGLFAMETIGQPIVNFYHFNEQWDRLRGLYEQYDFWIVFTAGFTPIPYKVFTIASGAFQISFVNFMIASLVGRAGRFFLVSALIWKFGAPMKRFIDKHFGWLSILFVVLLFAGFVFIKFVI